MNEIKKNVIKMISIDDIAIDTTQARGGEWIEDEKDEELINSIKGIGLIYNIIVRSTNSEKYGGNTDKPYAIVAGWRRFNALIRAGYSEVPCKILELSDPDAIAMSFSENIGRKDLTESQKMISVLNWLEILINEKYTEGTEEERKKNAKKEIADKCYKGNTTYINKILTVEKLPKELQILIKKPEERTDAERLILEQYDIKPDFKMNFQTLSIIKKITDHLGEIPPSEKVDKIFEMIQDFSLDKEKPWKEQEIILRDIRDKLKDKEKTFEIVMKEVKEEHNIQTPTMSDIPSVAFKIPSEYNYWHRTALSRAHMKTAQLVRQVYIQWLEKEAKKEGW
ncbi:MAG: hypothetical protein CEE43_13780 [Promethearchaeota archaeon Loki_b32]|nr:MAG: hypothetical protein CEE43_13780 [Candidatus Lokiarchaeota archaeon Loki_b32]